jgi:hypothetical protein
MKKQAIFCLLASVISLTVFSGAATAFNPQELENNRHIFIDVANDNGVKYDYDGDKYEGSEGTYYIKADGGGLNALHISNSASVQSGQVNSINAGSTSSSGTFYVTDTGGRGYNDDIVLMLSVKGTISSNFSATITSSGYSWTPVTTATQSDIDDEQYTSNAFSETFGKDDFIYGPHVFKPGPGTLGTWSLPLYYGQDTGDSSTAEYLMFIDLNLGTLKETAYFPDLTNNGSVKVDFSFTNMDTTASFNAYGWCLTSNQDEGINWTNATSGAGASGYTITYTGGQGAMMAAAAPVPIPAAAWLLGSGVSCLLAFRRKRIQA